MTDAEILSKLGKKHFRVLLVLMMLADGQTAEERMFATQTAVADLFKKLYGVFALSNICLILADWDLVRGYGHDYYPLYIPTKEGRMVVWRIMYCAENNPAVWGKFLSESNSPNIPVDISANTLKLVMQTVLLRKGMR